MKIGVTSDTHERPLPKDVVEAFRHVDVVIHAGDFCSVEMLKAVQKIATVKAVQGNMDDAGIRKLLPKRQLIDCEGVIIGLFHGEGAKAHLLERVRAEFKNDAVNVVVFGHSHVAMNAMIGDVLYFNPGSPNDPMAEARSYGILEIKNGKAVGKIVRLT